MRIPPPLRLLLTITPALAVHCAGSRASLRPPEVVPSERLMETALPDGVAETALAEGSPGDGPGGRHESRLLWIVATGTREYVYDLAACTALRTGEEPGDALVAARCDEHRYEVRREGDQLQLRRGGEINASLTVPTTWRVRVRGAPP